MIVNFKKYTLSIFLFFSLQFMYSQILDNLSFEEVEKQFYKYDKTKKNSFSRTYLQKAKQHEGSIKIANGYYLYSILHSHTNKSVIYVDSIIEFTKHWKYEKFLAKGYLQKGVQLYYLSNYSDALENYVMANKLYSKQKDQFNLLKVAHYIGLLKNAANQEKEALKIFKQNSFFFKNNNHKIKYENQYFKSLFALSDSYIRNKKLDSAEITSKIGIKESYSLKNNLYPHFLITFGAVKTLKNESDLAIDSLIKGINLIEDKKKSLCGAFFIVSDAYHKINDISSSNKYLKKIDSIYQKEPQVIFHAREANQKMYEHFKLHKKLKLQIQIIDKLLAIDSIIKLKYGDLDKKIIEEYETPLLLSKKEKLIDALEKEATSNRSNIIVLIIISFILIVLVIYFVARNRIYKRRFKNLINEDDSKTSRTKDDIIKITSSIDTIDLPEKIVEDIIIKLEKFEKSTKFTLKKYTLHSLSKELNTNSSYLSKVINATKDINFANYLNNLKIDFAINKLKTDHLFRSYTIKAIAEEVGFNTAQSFSTAFYKKTGIYPSYFLKKLNIPITN